MDNSLGDAVNIYGHIPDQSSVVIGAGNFNSISGLLTHYPQEELLQIKSLPDVIHRSVVELILNYESSISNPNKLHFSLRIKGTPNYVGVSIKDHKMAVACLSEEKTIFSIDYSSIDQSIQTHPNRTNLLAGSLYSLETVFGEQTYIVSWNIDGFSNGDLVIFLPTTWYEDVDCDSQTGVDALIHRLLRLQFKGYTTEKWCDSTPDIVHCQDSTPCGFCMGQCSDPSHICYPNLNSSGNNFVCGPIHSAPDMDTSESVTFTDSPSSTGTGATWLAIGLVFLVVIILVWGITRSLQKN